MFLPKKEIPYRFRLITCEDGAKRLINMEIVGIVERHQHEDGDHVHAQPAIALRLVNGDSVIALDDGSWPL